MGRWQYPSTASSPYITPDGFILLQEELRKLWNHRAKVTLALSAAAAEGDRSENAEYIYRKKELREIDRRLGYLQKRLPELKVVKEIGDKNKVFFGAIITLEKKTGDTITYRIVGSDEIDHDDINISMDSPMAKQLLGKSKHADITLEIKGEAIHYKIISIYY